MHAPDTAPKSVHNPNKIKINEIRTLMPLDAELELRLKEFREKLHAEWWGDQENDLLGPHIFLGRSQIRHLCNLANAEPLITIKELQNNFKWNWMDDHGLALLNIIHNVYGHPVVPNSNTGVAGIQEAESSAAPNAITSSNSKAHTRL